MKIAIDSNDMPAATRRETWRGMLCDTYIGMDGEFPDEFRSVIEGHALGAYSLTRITSSRHSVDRSPTLIKRDAIDMLFFGMPLAGTAVSIQAGREAVLEPGTIVVTDTSRPFRTHVEAAADIVWLGVPKKPIGDRLHGIEDLTALPLRPTRPVVEMALDLMAGFDAAMAGGVLAQDAERVTTRALDLLALTLASAELPTKGPRRNMGSGLIH